MSRKKLTISVQKYVEEHHKTLLMRRKMMRRKQLTSTTSFAGTPDKSTVVSKKFQPEPWFEVTISASLLADDGDSPLTI